MDRDIQENNCIDSLHTLEKESGVFFGMKHFLDLVTSSDLEEAENYLSGFTSIGDNIWSLQTFFSLRRQKYYEALERDDIVKADEILQKELKVFALFPQFREKKVLKNYEDTKSEIEHLLRELKHFIEENPLLQDKVHFPVSQNSRLPTLVDQGLKGEHQIFNNMGTEPYSTNIATSISNVGDILHKAAHERGDGKAQRDLNFDIQRDSRNPTEFIRTYEICSLHLPDPTIPTMIIKLTYTTKGDSLLALCYNAVLKLWKWKPGQPNGKASAKIKPRMCKTHSGTLLTNDTSGINPEEASPCFVLSKNENLVWSASGGRISLHNMETYKTLTTFKTPPPAASSIAWHPINSSLLAIGMDDSTIQIYDYPLYQVVCKLKGHQKKVTGLAFSTVLRILVSSDLESKLCVWDFDRWELRTSTFLQRPAAGALNIQFHKNQRNVLVVHESKVAVYEAPKMEVSKQWSPRQGATISAITYATYSCDSESIFVSLDDGRIAVLIAKTLLTRCFIYRTAYMPICSSDAVYPVAIAAHPSETNQFAIGLTNGEVYVLEPKNE